MIKSIMEPKPTRSFSPVTSNPLPTAAIGHSRAGANRPRCLREISVQIFFPSQSSQISTKKTSPVVVVPKTK